MLRSGGILASFGAFYNIMLYFVIKHSRYFHIFAERFLYRQRINNHLHIYFVVYIGNIKLRLARFIIYYPHIFVFAVAVCVYSVNNTLYVNPSEVYLVKFFLVSDSRVFSPFKALMHNLGAFFYGLVYPVDNIQTFFAVGRRFCSDFSLYSVYYFLYTAVSRLVRKFSPALCFFRGRVCVFFHVYAKLLYYPVRIHAEVARLYLRRFLSACVKSVHHKIRERTLRICIYALCTVHRFTAEKLLCGIVIQSCVPS